MIGGLLDGFSKLFRRSPAPVVGAMPPVYVYELSGRLWVIDNWSSVPHGCRVWTYRPISEEPKVIVTTLV